MVGVSNPSHSRLARRSRLALAIHHAHWAVAPRPDSTGAAVAVEARAVLVQVYPWVLCPFSWMGQGEESKLPSPAPLGMASPPASSVPQSPSHRLCFEGDDRFDLRPLPSSSEMIS